MEPIERLELSFPAYKAGTSPYMFNRHKALILLVDEENFEISACGVTTRCSASELLINNGGADGIRTRVYLGEIVLDNPLPLLFIPTNFLAAIGASETMISLNLKGNTTTQLFTPNSS